MLDIGEVTKTLVTMSIAGLYEFDETIFDGLVIPPPFEKDKLIGKLLMDLNEVEVLYANPITMKNCITLWSGVNQEQWAKLARLWVEEYNPIYNYDRTEEHHINETEGINRQGSVSGTGTNTENHKTAAFNMVNDPQTTDIVTDDNTANQTATSSDAIQRNGNNTIRAFGNIGVTTTAQMITGERDLWRNFNFYDLLIEDFKQRFCVMVY